MHLIILTLQKNMTLMLTHYAWKPVLLKSTKMFIHVLLIKYTAVKGITEGHCDTVSNYLLIQQKKKIRISLSFFLSKWTLGFLLLVSNAHSGKHLRGFSCSNPSQQLDAFYQVWHHLASDTVTTRTMSAGWPKDVCQTQWHQERQKSISCR